MAIYYIEDENSDPVPFHLKGDFSPKDLSQMGYVVIKKTGNDIYITKEKFGSLMHYRKLVEG